MDSQPHANDMPNAIFHRDQINEDHSSSQSFDYAYDHYPYAYSYTLSNTLSVPDHTSGQTSSSNNYSLITNPLNMLPQLSSEQNRILITSNSSKLTQHSEKSLEKLKEIEKYSAGNSEKSSFQQMPQDLRNYSLSSRNSCFDDKINLNQNTINSTMKTAYIEEEPVDENKSLNQSDLNCNRTPAIFLSNSLSNDLVTNPSTQVFSISTNEQARLPYTHHIPCATTNIFENGNYPQDLRVYSSRVTNEQKSVEDETFSLEHKGENSKPLPSIEGAITNSRTIDNINLQDEDKEYTPQIYHFTNDSPPNLKNHTEETVEYTITEGIQQPQTSSLNWSSTVEKIKTNVQPLSSSSSYGLVSHVLEQHFGLKSSDDLTVTTKTTKQNIDGELPEVSDVSSQFSSELVDNEMDDDIDVCSSSSVESPSSLMHFDVDLNSQILGCQKLVYIANQCKECGISLKSPGSLKVHMRVHTGEHPYVCQECGESFPFCALLHEHKLKHQGVIFKPFSCSVCGMTFNCEKHFKHHKKKHSLPKMYDCPECSQSFATKDRLNRHSRVHYGDISFFCEKCGRLFLHKHAFDEHKESHTSSTWNCEECDDVFDCSQQLEKHILSYHDTPDYSDCVIQPIQLSENKEDCKKFGCEICPLKFEKITDYYLHRRDHQSERSFKCDMCSVSFYKEFHLFVHSLSHSSEESFGCNSCEATFRTATALKFHMRKHVGELPFKCSNCELTFAKKEALLSHASIHTTEKPFNCDQCNASFRHSSTLKIHLRTHTGEKPYICEVCGASFIQNPHLQIHLRSHSNNKPYKCNECDASFTKKDYLFAHKTKHASGPADLIAAEVASEAGPGVQSLRCKYCEMTFPHQSTLAAHVRKHTGERPFVCDECGASFLYSSNLTTHRRKHTGERPYKCQECEASFTLKSYLTMHLRKHSGERPFKCDICESSFTQKTHLSTHRRIHTGEYPYKCNICGDAFRDGANFWRHKKRHNAELQSTPLSSREVKPKPKSKQVKMRKVGSGVKITPSTPSRISRRSVEQMEDFYEDHIARAGIEDMQENRLNSPTEQETTSMKEITDAGDGEEPPFLPIIVEIKTEDMIENTCKEDSKNLASAE